MKTVVTAKKPFGKAKYSPVKHARYLDWEDAFDVEFDDGLSFLEPHAAHQEGEQDLGRSSSETSERSEEVSDALQDRI